MLRRDVLFAIAVVLAGFSFPKQTNALIVIRDRNGNVIPGATSTTLAELINPLASIQIDDKVFEHWRGYSSIATNGAAPVAASQITVIAVGEGSCDPGPGVWFVSSQFVVSGIAQLQQTSFSYDVRAVSGASTISALRLRFGTVQTLLAGIVDITETVTDRNRNTLGTLNLQATSFDVNPSSGVDQLALATTQNFVSINNHILLSNGGPEDTGSASLGQFAENFLQPCAQPPSIACRVTGGSNRQNNNSQQPYITTAVPRFTSHAGEVGAPFGVASPFTAASACIRGEWQHNRHGTRRSLVGTFHAMSDGNVHQFDSLMCACLSCMQNPSSPGAIGELCNAGDRICGPDPRQAPANKICFSGVGDYTFGSAQKTVPAVFRVDIEDRGEPGGSSGSSPPDRYRIRLWLLDGSCGRAFVANSAAGQMLRRAVACFNAVSEDLGAGAGPPDIDDGGNMTQGNHQVQPLTGAVCP